MFESNKVCNYARELPQLQLTGCQFCCAKVCIISAKSIDSIMLQDKTANLSLLHFAVSSLIVAVPCSDILLVTNCCFL